MAYIHLHSGQAVGTKSLRAQHDVGRSGAGLVAGWDCDGRQVTAFADRVGVVPIFYWTGPSSITVADSLAEIVRLIPSPAFHDRAVATFLRLGFYLADDTPIAGVKVLPPGGQLIWDGKVALMSPGLPIQDAFVGAYKTAVDRYCELFESAIRDRAAGGVGRLTVSGGRDSRHIFLELLRQGVRPPAILTQDRPVNTDLEIGAALARRTGIAHIAVAPFRDDLRDELTKNRWNHYLADENAWYVQIAEYLDGPIFDGLAGGMLSGTDMFRADQLVNIIRTDPWRAAQELLRVIGSEPEFLPKPLGMRWRKEIALDAIAEELARHRHAPNPLTSFLFWNRTRREVALIPICIAARRVPVRLPYLDPLLMTFLSSLPHPVFAGTAFHSDVMARAYPEFASLPYGKKRKPPRSLRRVGERVLWTGRYARSPGVASRYLLESWVKALLTRESSRLGWFYRGLPIVQASEELGVPLAG